MKKTLLFAAIAALFAIASCQKEEVPIHDQNRELVFTASIAGQGTKVAIDATSGKVSWVSGDEITITDNALVSVKYVVSSIDDQGKATFTKKSGESGSLGSGPYTAVYGTAPATVQTYSDIVPDLPMSAESNTTALTFTVSCGLLELSLTAGESISNIEVKGTPTGGSETTYTLICTDPVSIESGAKFYIALPAGSYTSFLLYGQNGAQCKKEKSGSSVAITANQITPISFTSIHFAVQLWKDGPYWATTNIGANSATDYGLYFAWGYTTGYSRTGSGWKPSITFDATGFSDYQNHTYSDMAASNWGTAWSAPTKDQLKTLVNADNSGKCAVSYVTTGTKGIRITGTETGYTSNSIFVPAAGCGDGSSLYNTGHNGFYWSSVSGGSNSAYTLSFNPESTFADVGLYSTKYNGNSVRPVRSSL